LSLFIFIAFLLSFKLTSK